MILMNNDVKMLVKVFERKHCIHCSFQNVLKMELELREAKYRAQTESLKIQLIRDTETKVYSY